MHLHTRIPIHVTLPVRVHVPVHLLLPIPIQNTYTYTNKYAYTCTCIFLHRDGKNIDIDTYGSIYVCVCICYIHIHTQHKTLRALGRPSEPEGLVEGGCPQEKSSRIEIRLCLCLAPSQLVLLSHNNLLNKIRKLGLYDAANYWKCPCITNFEKWDVVA